MMLLRVSITLVVGLIAGCSEPETKGQSALDTVAFIVGAGMIEDGARNDLFIIKKVSSNKWERRGLLKDGKVDFIGMRSLDNLKLDVVDTFEVRRQNDCKYLIIEENFVPDRKTTQQELDFSQLISYDLENPAGPQIGVHFRGMWTVGTTRQDGRIERFEKPYMVIAWGDASRIERAVDYFRKTFCKGKAF